MEKNQFQKWIAQPFSKSSVPSAWEWRLSAPPQFTSAQKKNAAEMMDMFSHILPRKYNEGLLRKSSPCYNLEANYLRPARIGLDLRFKTTTKEILIPRSYERK